MELKPRERKEVDIQYVDEESGIHVTVQEVPPRTSHETKEAYFSVSLHVESDVYWNSFDLACPTEEQAREVAQKSFDFFKSIKPLLAVNIKEDGGRRYCHY